MIPTGCGTSPRITWRVLLIVTLVPSVHGYAWAIVRHPAAAPVRRDSDRPDSQRHSLTRAQTAPSRKCRVIRWDRLSRHEHTCSSRLQVARPSLELSVYVFVVPVRYRRQTL